MDSDNGPVDRYATERAASFGMPLIFTPIGLYAAPRRVSLAPTAKRDYNLLCSHIGVDTWRFLFAN